MNRYKLGNWINELATMLKNCQISMLLHIIDSHPYVIYRRFLITSVVRSETFRFSWSILNMEKS